MGSATLDDVLEKAYAEAGLEESDILEPKGYIPSGNLALDFILGGQGFPLGRSVELYGLSQSGKASAIDSLVLTPTGYVRMGELKVGDAVIDPYGQPSEVVGIFPQGEQDIYRLTFSDGSTCETTSDHLWPFRYRVSRRSLDGGRSSKRRGVQRARQIFVERGVVPLSLMMTSSRLSSSAWRPALDAELRSDLDFVEGPLLVDPYLLGLLLGDGCLVGPGIGFTSVDTELLDAVRSCLPPDVSARPAGPSRPRDYRLTSGNRGGMINPLTSALRELGLMGHKSDTKFIPDSYKIASAKTRLAILQGLLDTDAEACPGGGAAIFGSASRQLRDDVVWLARSLGMRVTIGERQIRGQRVNGEDYFPSYSARVCYRTVPLFRLSRKVEVWARRSKTGERHGWVDGVRPRVLVSVAFSRRAEAQCISVSAPSRLYVTDDFIPTHNTTTASMVAAQAQKQGLRVLYLDFEQALNEPYLNALGVNTRDRRLFIPFPAASLEHGSEVAVAAARTGQVGLIVFDSVAAMTPKSSVDEDKESRTLAMERARLLGNLLSKLNPILARTGTCALFINHLREVIDTGPTRPGMPKRTTTPGGTSLKFYSSVRVQFTVVKKWKAERIDPLTGEKVSDAHAVTSKAEVTKNKLAAPYQSAELYLELGRGFNQAWSAMQVLVGNKIVKKAGAYFQFPQDLYHPNMVTGAKGPSLQGLQSVLDLAETFPEWGAQLATAAVAALPAERVTVALPDLDAEEASPVVEDTSSLDEIPQEPVITAPTVDLPPPTPVGNGQTIRFVNPSGLPG